MCVFFKYILYYVVFMILIKSMIMMNDVEYESDQMNDLSVSFVLV